MILNQYELNVYTKINSDILGLQLKKKSYLLYVVYFLISRSIMAILDLLIIFYQIIFSLNLSSNHENILYYLCLF